MKPSHQITLRYDYGNDTKEHILVVRGRPFSVLESPHHPTPPSTFLDYNLAKELGLKMTNLQYEKMSYCGHKMRKLGQVSVTTQTLHDGCVVGNLHVKATVVLGLAQTIDADAVAGHKLLSQLSCSSPSSGPPSPSPRSPPTPTKSSPPPGRPSPPTASRTPASPTSPPPGRPSPTPSTPQHVRWLRFPSPTATMSSLSSGQPSPTGRASPPARPLAPSTPPSSAAPASPTTPQMQAIIRSINPLEIMHASSPPSTPQSSSGPPGLSSSPPGYPYSNYRSISDNLNSLYPAIGMSPLTANKTAFKKTFGSVESKDLDEQESYLRTKVDHDIWDDSTYDPERGEGFVKYYLGSDIDGGFYKSGHGMTHCSAECWRPDDHPGTFPSNCGYNQHWIKPLNFPFRPCGEECRGYLCDCLKQYHPAHFIRKIDVDEEDDDDQGMSLDDWCAMNRRGRK